MFQIRIPPNQTNPGDNLGGEWQTSVVPDSLTLKEQQKLQWEFFQTYSKKTEELDKTILGIKGRIDSNENDLKKQSDKNIEILGIFSAILALIIIDVSIIKSVESFLSAILLIIALTCSMLMFMSAIHYFFSPETNRKLGLLFWLPGSILIMLLVLGVWVKFVDTGYRISLSKATANITKSATSTP